MSQLGDTYKLHPQNKILSWFDDNETKYKWNGELINFSDMEPSEYSKTIFNVNIISGITGTTKIENPITLSLTASSSYYQVNAVASKPVASALQIGVMVNSKSFTITITTLGTSGQVLTDIGTGQTAEIVSATVVPATDETYQYNVVLPEDETKFTAYYGPYAEYKRGTISTEEIVALPAVTVSTTEQEISFILPQRASTAVTQDDKYCLLLAVPYTAYQKQSFTIKDNVFGNDLTLAYQNQFTLNSKKYALLASLAEGTEYTAKANRNVTLGYNIKSEKK